MKKKILFVDDNRPLLTFISRKISQSGHEIRTADDGFEALDVLSYFKPDIMFVDYFLPTIEGDKLINIIRNMKGMTNCYTVLVSGGALEAGINDRCAGADTFLAKGSFKQVAENALAIINESSDGNADDQSMEIIGAEAMTPRYLTRELISRTVHMRTILDSMEEGILEVRNERIVYVNPAACAIMKMVAENMLAQYATHLFAEIPPAMLASVEENHKITVERGERTIVVKVQPALKTDIQATLIFIRDITDEKKAEEALRDSEEKYRLLVENAQEAIFILREGRIQFPNPSALALMKKLDIPYRIRNVARLIHPNDRNDAIQKFKTIVRKEARHISQTFRLLGRSGEERWADINLISIVWEKKQAILVSLRDITRQKEMEAQFHQAQRMKSVGTLAGGVAHDFNNLLMGIQANISVLMLDADENPAITDRLKRIEKRVKSGAHLTRQLLDYARGGKYKTSLAHLDQIIEETALIFGRTRKEVRIHQTTCPDLWMVRIDVGQIEQVLLNLMINSSQAMKGGGDIFISTANETIGLDYGRDKPYKIKPGPYVKISLTDEGVGIPASLQKHIFEPFFTTRRLGAGTGLGLSSAYGIIKNHKGAINCYSEKGHGTTFTFYLPAVQEPAAEANAKAPVSEEKPLLQEEKMTILIIDDEIEIGNAIGDMFDTMGHEVIIAGGGYEGIAKYSEQKERVDIVVLDMIMPDLNGEKVFFELKKLNSQVKVLLSSGYSKNDVVESLLSHGRCGFIQKPYMSADIALKIHELIASSDDAPV